jgi:hypothetical protein
MNPVTEVKIRVLLEQGTRRGFEEAERDMVEVFGWATAGLGC